MATCYAVNFEVDGESCVAHVCADEVPTDPKTLDAIRAVCKAAYEELKDEDHA